MPESCGQCADARKAWKAMRMPSLMRLVEPEAMQCLIHLEPDVAHCRGCAADRKAAS